jgi:hypothetical protein
MLRRLVAKQTAHRSLCFWDWAATRGLPGTAHHGKRQDLHRSPAWPSRNAGVSMWELETHRSRCLHFGVDGNGNGSVNLNTKADALASTANFLKGHGWVRGAGYQPGSPPSQHSRVGTPLASIRRRSPSLGRRSDLWVIRLVTLNTLGVAEHIVRVEARLDAFKA